MVSVVIPCYNAEPFIAETIESVLHQTYADFELVLVDDGSTDRTAEILGSYSDPRVRVIRQANAGISAARNRGVAESRGSHVAFLDNDDLWLPEKLERQVAVLDRDPEIGLVYSDAFVMSEDGRLRNTFSDWMALPSGQVFEALLARNAIPTSTVMMRRTVFEAVGPFAPYKISQDYDLWLKCAARYRVACIAEPLIKYRHRVAGASRRVMVPLGEALEIYHYWSSRVAREQRRIIEHAAGELLYLTGKTVLYDNRDAALARRLLIDALRRRVSLWPALFYLVTFLPVSWTRTVRDVVKSAFRRPGGSGATRTVTAALNRR
jgi:glycosyltransferase involved in cell wall biosynthesis